MYENLLKMFICDVAKILAIFCLFFSSSQSRAEPQGSPLLKPSELSSFVDPKPSGQWWFKETINPMTDKLSWVAAYFDGPLQAQFYCDQTDFVAFYIDAPAMNLRQKTETKRSRIDDQIPREDEWGQSTHDRIVSLNVEPIARAMLGGHDRFVIEDFSGKSVVFSLVGFKQAVNELNSKCGWILDGSLKKRNPKWMDELFELTKEKD